MHKMLSSIAILAISGNALMAGGDIAPVEPVVLEETVSDEWKFHASLNFWGPDIKIKTTSDTTIKITLKDIVDNFNFGMMSTLGVQKGKWGILTDVLYFNISKGFFKPVSSSAAITNVKIKALIVTPMVTYRFFESDQWTLDMLGGARYLNIEVPIGINYIVQPDPSFNLWDGIVGLRGQYKVDEKWFIPFHFDVGGGTTDLTWQAFAGVGYKYENFDVVAGYRYLDWEFDKNNAGGKVLDQLTVDGPMLGFKYYF